MKQSGHLNPSEETGTGYHGGVGQQQQQSSHRSGKSQGKFYFLKVREKSVNFEFDIKSGRSQ